MLYMADLGAGISASLKMAAFNYLAAAAPLVLFFFNPLAGTILASMEFAIWKTCPQFFSINPGREDLQRLAEKINQRMDQLRNDVETQERTQAANAPAHNH
jgi:hypothetical protein